MGLFVF